MSSKHTDIVKTPLRQWVFYKNSWLQILLVIVAILAVASNLLPLEMQKRIVNEAIDQSRLDLLTRYCLIYLAAVISATVFKYLNSVLQNIIGQHTLKRMRDGMYRYILTLPLGFFHSTKPGLVVSALTTELATASDFAGMAVAIPVTNFLMLAAFGGYLLWLNPLLAVFSFSIYPLILLVVPILQKQVNRYNRKRVDATRSLSAKAGETISGMHEIHANNTFAIEGNVFGKLAGELSRIRIIWNLYRQGIKRANSLFVNFSRFLVFAAGGYLAVKGDLELGVLVAFISAQDKLYDPWKELIRFYQLYKTAQVTYERTMSYFDVSRDMTLLPSDEKPVALGGEIGVENLEFTIDGDTRLLSGVNLHLEPGEQLGLVGFSGSGKSTLVKCIGQLQPYSSGTVKIDDREVSELSKADIAANVGFVSQEPFIFDGTIEDNLLYACHGVTGTGSSRNSLPSQEEQATILEETGFIADVLGFGLNTILDVDRHDTLAGRIVDIRRQIHATHREELGPIVEFYDQDKYVHHESVAQNILYGESREDALQVETITGDPRFISILRETDLLLPLLRLGSDLLQTTIKSRQHSSSDQKADSYADLIPPDSLKEYTTLSAKLEKIPPEKMNRRNRRRLLQIALNFIPEKHTFFELPDELAELIVTNRAAFKTHLQNSFSGELKECDLSTYLSSRTILTNLLFGRIKDDSSSAHEKIHSLLRDLLEDKGILQDIVWLGVQYRVGSEGSNLSGGQKQKLAIARALLKNPSILILDEATSGLDTASQENIQRLLKEEWRGKSTVISIVHRIDMAKDYDRIAVMKDGEIVEEGTHDELIEKDEVFAELVKANR